MGRWLPRTPSCWGQFRSTPNAVYDVRETKAFCSCVSLSCGLGAGQMHKTTLTRERWEGTRTPRCKVHTRRKATLPVLGGFSVGVELRRPNG